MTEILFHPDTVQEIRHSYQWYQDQAVGLGDNFLEELESAFDAITELPETWPLFTKNCRRFLLRKFPFSVVYKVNNNTVFVVAIMHNSRKPGYWEDRS